VIDAFGLTRRFGQKVAVDGVSLHVDEGEVFAFLGPNGAGKTTTIRMLACLIAPTSGTATVAGHDVVKEPMEVRRCVGVLTENPCLYERLSAYENLEYFGDLFDIPAPERRKRIRDFLEFMGLWERRGEKVGAFSKGMRQKLAVARALLHSPSVIFLDEPTAGLDPAMAKAVRDLIETLAEKERRTVFLCTHNLSEAEKLCSKIAVINEGRIAAVGSPDDLQRRLWRGSRVELVLERLTPGVVRAVEGLGCAKDVHASGERLSVGVSDPRSDTPEVVEAVVRAGGRIISVQEARHSLEDIYLKLVRDEG